MYSHEGDLHDARATCYTKYVYDLDKHTTSTKIMDDCVEGRGKQGKSRCHT
jgi:hypothetical protein